MKLLIFLHKFDLFVGKISKIQNRTRVINERQKRTFQDGFHYKGESLELGKSIFWIVKCL